MHAHSFPPVIDSGTRVLILGSMPGKVSLQAREYYAHPRNLFWHLMELILEVDRPAPYPERIEQLLARGVGLWDVLQCCTRATSLDSDIDPGSIVLNDFPGLIGRFPAIETLCFNGAKASALFRKRVLPRLSGAGELDLRDLPSTSPANAAIPFEVKVEAWRVVATVA